MFKEGDLVIYGMEGICRVADVREEHFTGDEGVLYYILDPLLSKTKVIRIPVASEQKVAMVAAPCRSELEKCLDGLASIKPLEWISDKNLRITTSKETLKSGNLNNIASLIKMYDDATARAVSGITMTERQIKENAIHLFDRTVAAVLDIELDVAKEKISAGL